MPHNVTFHQSLHWNNHQEQKCIKHDAEISIYDPLKYKNGQLHTFYDEQKNPSECRVKLHDGLEKYFKVEGFLEKSFKLKAVC